jgi:hypothetical protein
MLPALLIVWGVLVAAFVALMIYRAALVRRETDQLFLSDADNAGTFVHEEQDEIVRKVVSIEPLCRAVAAAAGLASLAVIGVYLYQQFPNIRL